MSAMCPAWCESHSPETSKAGSSDSGGVSTTHYSRRVAWSHETPDTYAQIQQTHEAVEGPAPAGIFISHGEAALDGLHDITADEARRLAAALLILSDELERG